MGQRKIPLERRQEKPIIELDYFNLQASGDFIDDPARAATTTLSVRDYNFGLGMAISRPFPDAASQVHPGVYCLFLGLAGACTGHDPEEWGIFGKTCCRGYQDHPRGHKREQDVAGNYAQVQFTELEKSWTISEGLAERLVDVEVCVGERVQVPHQPRLDHLARACTTSSISSRARWNQP